MSAHGPNPRRRDRGFALVAVLIALALVAVLGAALTAIGAIEYRTAINHRSATRALLLADAGATHALAVMRGPLADREYSDILRGSDGVFGTADDGILDGFALDASDALPEGGVRMGDGIYTVRIVNDPEDPSGDPGVDSNHRLVAECRGTTDDGGVAQLRVVLASYAFPALVSNGDLLVPGTSDVLGPCAGVHANGSLTVDGSPTVNGDVTATKTVTLSGTIRDESGEIVIPRSDEPPIDVPDYDALEHCADANYVLRNGWYITAASPPDSAFIGTGEHAGWRWNGGSEEYSLSGRDAVAGIFCVHGNVTVTGNAGSTGDPLEMSLFATGSVNIGGNPRLTPAPGSEDILIVADGDLEISGNPSSTTPAYSGMLYAGSQCRINGNPNIGGFVLCHDSPDPAGSVNLVDENKLNGNPEITHDCSGQRRRTSIASWSDIRR